MKRAETRCNPELVGDDAKKSSYVDAPYEQVYDGRKQRVRGLWKRGPMFYGRFQATDQAGRKRDVFRSLEGVETVPAAKATLQRLREESNHRTIPVAGRCPTFAEYADRYLAEVSPTKRLATARKERTHLEWWKERLGSLTLRQIHRTHVNSGIGDLTKSKLSNRTANLYTISLRGVLKRAVEEGLIRDLPTHGLKPLKVASKKRELIDMMTFTKLLEASSAATKNSVQFKDYYRFLLFSGAREAEALCIRWADVDFTGKQVTIGWDGGTKNHEARRVDFNPPLESLLSEMYARRAPDSQWLFPSPQRGDQDGHAKTFRESLRQSCDAAGVPRFGFHDARHAFISQCVMAGIDYMTIAKWVGHKDGGVLVGKVYGHIANDHRRNMASRFAYPLEASA